MTPEQTNIAAHKLTHPYINPDDDSPEAWERCKAEREADQRLQLALDARDDALRRDFPQLDYYEEYEAAVEADERAETEAMMEYTF